MSYLHTYTERSFTFALHAHVKAFDVSAVLTAISLPLVYETILFIPTGILQLLANCPLEETLTAFTTVYTYIQTNIR